MGTENKFTEHKTRLGFTLIEVMFAAVLIGIVAAVTGNFLIHAHRERMNTRIRRAATIEANALMEQAFWAVKQDSHVLSNLNSSVQFLDYSVVTDTNGINSVAYTLSSANPDLNWEYDHRLYSKAIRLNKKQHDGRDFAAINVAVRFDAVNTARTITLETERLIHD